MKDYKEAVKYLDGFINYEKRLERVIYNQRTFDLESFHTFLKTLGNPQDQFPCLHIAGTKGKGSVAAMLEGALLEANLRIGLYTSPHIESYLERIRTNGTEITEERFTRYLDFLRKRIEEKQPEPPRRYRTVFELLTAMAFLFFRDENLDLAILETGLGGRLDATNVVKPVLCIITTLGLEHTNLLGDTLSGIAREKGGIVKEGVPVVLSKQESPGDREILPVIESICREKKAPLVFAEERVKILRRDILQAGGTNPHQISQRILFGFKDGSEREVDLPLAGKHQLENCRTVLTALEILCKTGMVPDMERAIRGIGKTKWPGRFEILKGEPTAILDGAHCPLSARALSRTLEEYFPERRRILAIGVMKGKNASEIARELGKDPLLSEVIAFPPPSPRGLAGEELAAHFREVFPGVKAASSLESALETAVEGVKPGDVLVVAGSIYNIAPARQVLTRGL